MSKSPPPLVIRAGAGVGVGVGSNASLHGLASQLAQQICNSIIPVSSAGEAMAAAAAAVSTPTVSTKQTNLMRVDAASDKTPRIGPEFQADIPDLMTTEADGGKKKRKAHDACEGSELLWDPRTAARISAQSMQSFLTLASSCLVPGGSRNEEAALTSLQVRKQGTLIVYLKFEFHTFFKLILESSGSTY